MEGILRHAGDEEHCCKSHFGCKVMRRGRALDVPAERAARKTSPHSDASVPVDIAASGLSGKGSQLWDEALDSPPAAAFGRSPWNRNGCWSSLLV